MGLGLYTAALLGAKRPQAKRAQRRGPGATGAVSEHNPARGRHEHTPEHGTSGATAEADHATTEHLGLATTALHPRVPAAPRLPTA